MADDFSRGELTRENILEAARQLFVQQGYHGTSMRQIAARAGIALGSLYNHFPNKEEVFHVVFVNKHPYREIVPVLLAAEGDNVESFVRDAAYRLLRSLENRPDLLNLMFIELVEFNSIHIPELFAVVMPQAMELVQRITGLGQGQLRSFSPLILVRSFLGLFFSYYMTELIIAPVAPPGFMENAADHFIDIYLHGILIGD